MMNTISLIICPYIFLLEGIQPAGASNSPPRLGSVMLLIFLVHLKTLGDSTKIPRRAREGVRDVTGNRTGGCAQVVELPWVEH